MVTMAGAMSTAEIGRSLAPLIRGGKIHAITCTGANLEEDVFNLVAHSKYQRIPNWRNLSEADEAELHEQGFNRVTDTCIPEAEAIRHIEDKIIKQWKSKSAFPHEHLMAILDDLEPEIPTTTLGWLQQEMQVYLFMFQAGNSTLGDIFAAHCIKGAVDRSAVKTGVDYMIPSLNIQI